MMMHGDMTLYLTLMAPCMLLAMWAQWRLSSTYAKYRQMPNSRGFTGAQAAAEMLRREGVTDCRIEETSGWLSDHYSPSEKTLRLSPEVYNGRTVTAVGIACHEAGHALQHAHGYGPLALRTVMVPVASLGSHLPVFLIVFGAAIGMAGMYMTGFALFSAIVAFQVVTLPVEFNASSRAKLALWTNGVITRPDEIEGVDRVLGAAAMTYVAAAFTSIMTLLYYAIQLGLIGGRREE